MASDRAHHGCRHCRQHAVLHRYRYRGAGPAGPNGSPVLLADEPAPSGFTTRVELTMPTQIRTGIAIDLKAQAFGVDANKGVNGGMVQFLVDGAPSVPRSRPPAPASRRSSTRSRSPGRRP
ncbi:hypothetical protein P9209_08515 [Prescottella defluvii]|nr:hypothetical protein P9209_08515 [Prescottella defluvii]